MASRYFVTGGCVYRMQGDERRAASIATLAVLAVRRGDQLAWAGHQSMHTSNLPQGRCLWLRELIEDTRVTWVEDTRVTWGISIDGDTVFDGGDLLHELPAVTGAVAIGICPVRIGGTGDLCNVNLDDADERNPLGTRATWGERLKRVIHERTPIASGGFGVVVFNLEWFRNHWRNPEPERVAIDTGEDIELCRSVRSRGGKIIALGVRTDHFAWGESQTR